MTIDMTPEIEATRMALEDNKNDPPAPTGAGPIIVARKRIVSVYDYELEEERVLGTETLWQKRFLSMEAAEAFAEEWQEDHGTPTDDDGLVIWEDEEDGDLSDVEDALAEVRFANTNLPFNASI